MAKVGIMSMQRIANYGSFLQAYALKSILEELGHDVEFVDYHVCPPLIRDNSEDSHAFKRMWQKGIEALRSSASLHHKLQFIKFKSNYAKKYLPLLGVTDVYNYNPSLDYLIIGSDEVFNCVQKNVNVGFSPELFGVNNNAKKLMTYAASFGNTTIKKLQQYDKLEEVASYLKKFSVISVRDANSGKIVEELTDSNVEYNLDPVLVYDYFNKCKRIKNISSTEKYLILYAYSGRITDSEADWIARYAKKRDLKIYAIGGAQKNADRFIDCSPFEVLSYFKNAEEVITDTFHGSIFATIAHKPFTTIIRKSVGSSYGNEEKLTDLLNRLQLSSRMTTDIKEVANINSNPIDFSITDSILDEQREKTYNYLSCIK